MNTSTTVQPDLQEERYKVIVSSDFFSTNWMSNARTSPISKEKRRRGMAIVSHLRRSQHPILDAGSNVGFHTLLASRDGHDVISMDLSLPALAQGKRIGWISDAICGDVMHLPFRNDCFSGAILSEVIEEIPDQQGAISELSRCSERAIITTSPIKSDAFYGATKSIKRAIGEFALDVAHVNELHPSALFAMLENARLVPTKVSFHNPFHVWNLMALFPILRHLDCSPLDKILGYACVSGSVLCVAERRAPTHEALFAEMQSGQ